MMPGTVRSWVIGLVVSLILGHFVSRWSVHGIRVRLRERLEVEAAQSGDPLPPRRVGMSAQIVGVVERLFFTIAIGFDMTATIPAMVGWIALKMAADWNRQPAVYVPGAMTAAFGGLLSMLFAMVGGLICRAKF